MDDKHKRHSGDQYQINLSEPYEVRQWCNRFGCTEVQLRGAVAAVGKSVEAVRKYLERGGG